MTPKKASCKLACAPVRRTKRVRKAMPSSKPKLKSSVSSRKGSVKKGKIHVMAKVSSSKRRLRVACPKKACSSSSTPKRALRRKPKCEEIFTKEGKLLKRGGVVRCYLMGHWDHSGIYVGDGQIVHLVNERDEVNETGEIVKTSFQEFLDRMGGWNPAWNVDVACDRHGKPCYSLMAAAYAESCVGDTRDYNFAFRNCHHFTGECIRPWLTLDERKNEVWPKLKSILKGDFGFSWLEEVIREEFGEFKWRECDI